MVRDDSDAILDDMLARWHGFCKGYAPGAQVANGVFRDALRAKGEQTLEAISEDTYWANVFEALDFHVPEMKEPWRAAIYITARNCYTGKRVWLSPRLPKDRQHCAEIIQQARGQLIRRLVGCGVM